LENQFQQTKKKINSLLFETSRQAGFEAVFAILNILNKTANIKVTTFINK